MRFAQVLNGCNEWLKLIEELDQTCYALWSLLDEQNDQVLKLTHENERLRAETTDE